MKRLIKNAIGIGAISVIVITIYSCGGGKKEPVTELKGKETLVEGESPSPASDEGTTFVCLAGKLNVSPAPGTGSNVVGAISRGERILHLGDTKYLREDPSGYTTWSNVRLSDGTEGWVADIFIVTLEDFKFFEEVDNAARSGDAAATEAGIKAMKTGAGDLRYSPSPDGEKYLISIDGSTMHYFVMLGNGFIAGFEAVVVSEVHWSYDSRFFAIDVGMCVGRGLSVFKVDTMAKVLNDSVWSYNYDFARGTGVLVWVSTLNYNDIEYPLIGGPATKGDAIYTHEIQHTMEMMPCVYVFDCNTGEKYMAAAPDVTTFRERDGYGRVVILKPTGTFAANPLFELVSETGVYKEWVGKEVEGWLTEE